MSRALIVLKSIADRAKAVRWIDALPTGTQVVFIEPKRTIDQNSRLWLLLSMVSKQVLWHNLRLPPEDWKDLFMAALNSELRLVPNLTGNGFVSLGRSTSALSKAEFGDLMTIIEKWGAENDVVFDKDVTAPQPMDSNMERAG